LKSYVTYYKGKDKLNFFIEDNNIPNSKQLLIQVFTSCDENKIRDIISEITQKLSNAIVIGSTTDGEIAHGKSSRNSTVISFVLFEKSTLISAYDTTQDSFNRGKNLASKLKSKNSKVFILFSEGLNTNGEEFLKGVEVVSPNIIVAGGLAGDNAKFQKTIVFLKDKILDNGAVGVSINSDSLRTFNDYNFNWQKIGKKLKITKAKDNIVYEIDGRSAIETYKHYLGDKIVYKIPSVCIEFPLLVDDNGALTARSVIDIADNDALVFCANLKEGSEVYFGYGNPEEILKYTNSIPKKLNLFKPEAIFVYSCMARLHFLGEIIDKELEPIARVEDMAGFFTYGEFFSSQKNQFFNQTMTVLALSEAPISNGDIMLNDTIIDNSQSEWNSINALIHLVNKTTQELVQYHSFKDAYNKFENLFEYSGNAVAVVSNGRFIECNYKVVKLFGFESKDEFLSIGIMDLISKEYQEFFKQKLKEIEAMKMEQKIKESKIELIAVDKNDRKFWVEITLTVTYENDIETIYIVYNDINHRKEIEKSLQEQRDMLYYKAYHDELTGLPNRKYFMEAIAKQISENKNNNKKMAIFFIDLDKLKMVNDTLGHDAGDVMIKTVANRINNCVNTKGIVSRLGGDEFMVMLKDIDSIDEATEIANKILVVTQEPIILDIDTFYTSASIGIAIYPDDAQDAMSLLKYSDIAMYKAKANGGNQYSIYQKDMSQQALKQMEMEVEFMRAFRNSEFEVFFLPQYDMKQNSISSVEALVRWNHPTKGVLQPNDFLPYIEKLNLLYRLDKWIMNSAMKTFVKWKEEGIAPNKLSLNIRITELVHEQWERKILKSMKRLSFDSSWLEVEISEQEIMKHPKRVVSLLESLHNKGVDIVIDDFGTGYSSLKQLKALPISKIKIDKIFIVDLPKDEDALIMSNIIISLAKHLKVTIIAEGVETKEQVDVLLKNGCREAQGFYFAKPMNAKTISNILRKENNRHKELK